MPVTQTHTKLILCRFTRPKHEEQALQTDIATESVVFRGNLSCWETGYILCRWGQLHYVIDPGREGVVGDDSDPGGGKPPRRMSHPYYNGIKPRRRDSHFGPYSSFEVSNLKGYINFEPTWERSFLEYIPIVFNFHFRKLFMEPSIYFLTFEKYLIHS